MNNAWTSLSDEQRSALATFVRRCGMLERMLLATGIFLVLIPLALLLLHLPGDRPIPALLLGISATTLLLMVGLVGLHCALMQSAKRKALACGVPAALLHTASIRTHSLLRRGNSKHERFDQR
ncbi:hypothetical protein [Pseudomonas citronellolis]|uniref:hypothetical protein n=1 Tax=Pseudomonas citronellolis TaxID=53408 RepID=UPI0023E396D1|nr:hypothetical protein [Pseudomonas citronellolis]MDF3934765.1 hypothetical protein [Pseudomonas citronellolis]